MPKGTPGRPPSTCHPDRPHVANGKCNPCYKRERYWVNVDRRREVARHSQRKVKYGLTVGEFEAMKLTQGNRCAICGDHQEGDKELAVDHDHTTGRIRGLLCSWCNRGLGYFRDSVDLLSASARYLGA